MNAFERCLAFMAIAVPFGAPVSAVLYAGYRAYRYFNRRKALNPNQGDRR